jgi:hypothetical protein
MNIEIYIVFKWINDIALPITYILWMLTQIKLSYKQRSLNKRLKKEINEDITFLIESGVNLYNSLEEIRQGIKIGKVYNTFFSIESTPFYGEKRFLKNKEIYLKLLIGDGKYENIFFNIENYLSIKDKVCQLFDVYEENRLIGNNILTDVFYKQLDSLSFLLKSNNNILTDNFKQIKTKEQD